LLELDRIRQDERLSPVACAGRHALEKADIPGRASPLVPCSSGPKDLKSRKYWKDQAMTAPKPRLSRRQLAFSFIILVSVALMVAGLFYWSTPQRQDPTIHGEQLEFSKNAGSDPENHHPTAAAFPSQQPEKHSADHTPEDFQADGISPEQTAADPIGPQVPSDRREEELVYFGENYSEPFDTKKMEKLLSMANTLCRDEIDHDLPSDIWISPLLLVLDIEENHRRLRQLHEYCDRKKQGLLQSDDEERARQIKKLFLIERLDAIAWFEEDMADIFEYGQSEEIRIGIDEAKEDMIALMLDALERYDAK
jgi:hypothetical protein